MGASSQGWPSPWPQSPPFLLVPHPALLCASRLVPVGRCLRSLPRASLPLGTSARCPPPGRQAAVPAPEGKQCWVHRSRPDLGEPADLSLTLLPKVSSSLQHCSPLPPAPSWCSSTCKATLCAKQWAPRNTWPSCYLQSAASSPKRPCPHPCPLTY